MLLLLLVVVVVLICNTTRLCHFYEVSYEPFLLMDPKSPIHTHIFVLGSCPTLLALVRSQKI